MVSGVQNNVGASAYTKSSQLGSSSSGSSNFKKEVTAGTESPSSAPAEAPKKAEKSEESSSTQTQTPQKGQLEAKNDNETLRTEPTRGSLLDISA